MGSWGATAAFEAGAESYQAIYVAGQAAVRRDASGEDNNCEEGRRRCCILEASLKNKQATAVPYAAVQHRSCGRQPASREPAGPEHFQKVLGSGQPVAEETLEGISYTPNQEEPPMSTVAEVQFNALSGVRHWTRRASRRCCCKRQVMRVPHPSWQLQRDSADQHHPKATLPWSSVDGSQPGWRSG